MNEASAKVKQQIVDKIKSSTNILVTVGCDPSVDDLSAALGLTALLNKLDKHATAIFSGAIPPAISFLEPDKVFENTADSLRDFIIALDKEKADHLRYKVEGDVVKIFITPYRTTITSDDLDFSQGDFNVELVLALNVASQEQLDEALVAHGNILDNVTVATITYGTKSSQLGSVDWHSDAASCLSEMIVGLADPLKSDESLLDKQISTALLTGIVAATDRFSNEYTSSQSMTIAAQLMSAGADQQLIAAKLQESHAINAVPTTVAAEKPEKTSKASSDGSLNISHEDEKSDVEIVKVPTIDQVLADKMAEINPQTPLQEGDGNVFEPTTDSPLHDVSEAIDGGYNEPSLGGTLNATSEQAAEDARQELDGDQNKTILSHEYVSDPGNKDTAINGIAAGVEEAKPVDIFSEESINEQVATKTDGLPLPPPLPDFSTLPPTPLAAPATLPEPTTDIMSTITPPPIAEPEIMPEQVVTQENTTSTLPIEPAPNDPSQFKIPGQN